jgi:hypothetical protein
LVIVISLHNEASNVIIFGPDHACFLAMTLPWLQREKKNILNKYKRAKKNILYFISKSNLHNYEN